VYARSTSERECRHEVEGRFAGLDACATLTPTHPFCSVAEKMVDLNNCDTQTSVNY
jgi:hypothetical protein